MLLIKNATLIDPGHSLHGKKRDIYIKRGKIEEIKAKLQMPNVKTWDLKGACVSIGWMDIGAQIGDPGFEYRETLESAAQAAAFGGYTGIACLPNTNPAIHSKSEVKYIQQTTREELVDFYPIGAVSRDCKGKDIAELYDMHSEGAKAFSDGLHNIQDGGLMMRALQYVKAFDGLVMNQPSDSSITDEGQVHEGLMSTSLGMKGIPALAEELMLQRDLYLLEYTDSRLHVTDISSERAVALLKQAKAQKLAVTSSVPAMNLVFEDKVLEGFDTHYKVFPPLRGKRDLRALRNGLKNGTIDLISSRHIPLDSEAKNLEFTYADFGVIGLETTFALCHTHLVGETLNLDALITILAKNPRKILGLEMPKIEEGAVANLTVFDPKREWTFAKSDIRSRSKNTPFVDATFLGKVLGVVNGTRFSWFD